MEGSSKKEKGLTDMDNSVVMGRRGYKGAKWEWKNCNKKIKKNTCTCSTFNLTDFFVMNIIPMSIIVLEALHDDISAYLSLPLLHSGPAAAPGPLAVP